MDIRIPRSKIDIEVDGRQHLMESSVILNDIQKSETAHNTGFATIHVTNHDIYENGDKIAKAIAEASAVREEELLDTLKK